jgi:hypothetical protein
MKTVHSFNYITGIYLGPVVLTDADLSPLEPDVYLMPGNCVEIAPPTPGDGQFVAWTGSEWALGTSSQPEPVVVEDPQKAINLAAQAYLSNTDWYVIRKQETGTAIPADVLQKRQAARDAVKAIL